MDVFADDSQYEVERRSIPAVALARIGPLFKQPLDQ